MSVDVRARATCDECQATEEFWCRPPVASGDLPDGWACNDGGWSDHCPTCVEMFRARRAADNSPLVFRDGAIDVEDRT